ncbi:ADC synthase [Linnemannia elongata AG-77]|uniref:aminodeoxychorismate synthase n=1 Tax=Linnemannia elongata AG-77 TaxID=1314771 RepID=A0A197K015_9FUNG|nr:ADC synthase [Linnemannia elongata AG-77]
MPTPVVGSPISLETVDRNMDKDTIVTAMAASTTNATTATDNPTLLPLRTLIVDNYDSYTFNLLQLFDEDLLKNVVVIRNNQFEWSVFEQEILPYFDQIILSPGPGRPERAQDFGICTQILQTSHIPVFGVCLGHQGIGWTHGAAVTYGPEPVHGQIAHIKHDNKGIFQGIPQEFEAVRYHSLVVQENDLPDTLVATAWCHSFPLIAADNLSSGSVHISNTDRVFGSKVLMGLRHRTLPHHGVQFHPESICTQFGKRMMTNFFRISTEFYADQDRLDNTLTIPDYIHRLSVVPTEPTATHTIPPPHHSLKKQSNPFSLFIQALDPSIFPEPEKVFSSLFLTGPRSKAASWWLDSARQPHPMARFSFMGGVETRSAHRQNYLVPGSAQAVIQYSTIHKEVFVRRYQNQSPESPTRVKLDDGSSGTFWDWTSNVMAEFGKNNVETTVEGPNGEQCDFDSVPFDFFAGMVGYLGYEMKRESLEGYHTPVEQECRCLGHTDVKAPCSCDCVKQPDASFVLATQAVVYDHVDKRVYVLGVVNNQPGRILDGIGGSIGFESWEGCRNWVQDVSRSIVQIATDNQPAFNRRNSTLTGPLSHAGKSEPYLIKQRHRRQSSAGLLSPFKVDVTEKDYLRAIQDSLDYIHEGESYELCLTTQFRAKVPLYQQLQDKDQYAQGDPAFDLYRILRKLNPAPFSAFLSLPTAADEPILTQGYRHGRVPDAEDGLVSKVIILSSSPERFLKIGRRPGDEEMTDDTSRTVEMKPIKGTVAVAKGCFCKEDEGCGVEEQDGDSADHTQDEDEEDTPERHGTVRDRCAEARRREDQSRIDSLSKNIKERAENLMIVDLIRNDLAHVCKAKSVRVPYLMHVESYETVHQLVTTVRGELFDHVDNTQAVRACFPPGSMTGAPKLRSVQLLDSLEHHVRRGIYSGCLGYIGIPAVAAPSQRSIGDETKVRVRSAADLSVVIRTAVLSVEPQEDKEGQTQLVGELSVGAGGALTILSDANEEWREVLLKSRSVVPSVLTYLHQNCA